MNQKNSISSIPTTPGRENPDSDFAPSHGPSPGWWRRVPVSLASQSQSGWPKRNTTQPSTACFARKPSVRMWVRVMVWVVNLCLDGWIDWWMDGWCECYCVWWCGWWICAWMDGWIDGWMHGWMDGANVSACDGVGGESVLGWMDGWMDRWVRLDNM